MVQSEDSYSETGIQRAPVSLQVALQDVHSRIDQLEAEGDAM